MLNQPKCTQLSDSTPSAESLPMLDSRLDEQPVSGCCRLSRTTGAALLILSLFSVAAAAYLAGKQSQPGVYFPPIDATAAISSEKYSMATGSVSDQAEGLFVLDHNSGLLKCTVIYPRVGQFMATFTANVNEALASGGKGGSYMMVTGFADFPRSSNVPAAPSIVYVLDTATGNYACYGIPFNQAAVNSRAPQTGAMVLINTGTASPVIDRDGLR